MLKKAIENTAQSIDYSGEILAVSPCSYKQKIADYSLLFPLILLKYYNYTNDKAFLSKMLPICKYINDYFLKFADTDGLLNQVDEQWNLVDWPDNCRDNYDFELCDPIKEGATTCFEAWGKERKVNTSLFHPWSTSPIIILFEEFNDYLQF